MGFETKLFKIIMRFSKDNGKYMSFRKKINSVKRYYNSSTERNLIRKMGTPKEVMYCITPTPLQQKFFYYFFEPNKNFFKKIFIKFLEEKNILCSFRYNVDYLFIQKARPSTKLIEIDEDKIITVTNILIPFDYLLAAFEWAKTKEGHSYWENFNREWIGIVNKFVIEKYL